MPNSRSTVRSGPGNDMQAGQAVDSLVLNVVAVDASREAQSGTPLPVQHLTPQDIKVKQGFTIVETVYALPVPIAPGTAYQLIIYPPAGKKYQLASLYMRAGIPAFAANGSHIFNVQNLAGVIWFHGRSTFASQLRFQYHCFDVANMATYPDGNQVDRKVYDDIKAINTVPLVIEYNNQTNVAQAVSPSVIVRWESEDL